MRLVLILLLVLFLPAPSSSQVTPPGPASPAAPAGGGEEEIEAWQETLLEARGRLERAREQVVVTQQAFRDARKRNRRGGERGELLAAQQAAEQELAEAEAELPALLEQARRAGVPPGVLQQFED